MRRKLEVAADMSHFDRIRDFIEEELTREDCPADEMILFLIAVEEIYSNIAFYAYPEGEGNAEVDWEFDPESRTAVIRFSDKGKPYNPLKKRDPDVTLSAADRPIGGLGIYMVKNSMDHVAYEYADGKNILTLEKNFGGVKNV